MTDQSGHPSPSLTNSGHQLTPHQPLCSRCGARAGFRCHCRFSPTSGFQDDAGIRTPHPIVVNSYYPANEDFQPTSPVATTAGTNTRTTLGTDEGIIAKEDRTLFHIESQLNLKRRRSEMVQATEQDDQEEPPTSFQPPAKKPKLEISTSPIPESYNAETSRFDTPFPLSSPKLKKYQDQDMGALNSRWFERSNAFRNAHPHTNSNASAIRLPLPIPSLGSLQASRDLYPPYGDFVYTPYYGLLEVHDRSKYAPPRSYEEVQNQQTRATARTEASTHRLETPLRAPLPHPYAQIPRYSPYPPVGYPGHVIHPGPPELQAPLPQYSDYPIFRPAHPPPPDDYLLPFENSMVGEDVDERRDPDVGYELLRRYCDAIGQRPPPFSPLTDMGEDVDTHIDHLDSEEETRKWAEKEGESGGEGKKVVDTGFNTTTLSTNTKAATTHTTEGSTANTRDLTEEFIELREPSIREWKKQQDAHKLEQMFREDCVCGYVPGSDEAGAGGNGTEIGYAPARDASEAASAVNDTSSVASSVTLGRGWWYSPGSGLETRGENGLQEESGPDTWIGEKEGEEGDEYETEYEEEHVENDEEEEIPPKKSGKGNRGRKEELIPASDSDSDSEFDRGTEFGREAGNDDHKEERRPRATILFHDLGNRIRSAPGYHDYTEDIRSIEEEENRILEEDRIHQKRLENIQRLTEELQRITGAVVPDS